MHQAGDPAQGAGHGARISEAPGQDADQVLWLADGRLEPVA
jgi:hypothetical protein